MIHTRYEQITTSPAPLNSWQITSHAFGLAQEQRARIKLETRLSFGLHLLLAGREYAGHRAAPSYFRAVFQELWDGGLKM